MSSITRSAKRKARLVYGMGVTVPLNDQDFERLRGVVIEALNRQGAYFREEVPYFPHNTVFIDDHIDLKPLLEAIIEEHALMLMENIRVQLDPDN